LRDVLIRSVGRVDSLDPLSKTSKLVADPPTGEEKPLGGKISVSGSANISGAGRKIQKYSLWYAPYNVTLNKWVDAPMDHTTLPAGWIGPIIPAIEYTPPQGHTWNCGIFSGSNIVSNGDLTKKWVKSTCPFGIPPEYWWLKLIRWDTSSLGSGRFTILLMVEDDLGGIYYDSQRVWIDNKKIEGHIKGIKGLKPCEDLKMSLGKVPVLGAAYDPPIDDTIPIVHPNDNFKHYRLWFRKQGAGTYQDIPPGVISTPVGPGAGVLVDWDLEMLDATTNPSVLPKNQLLETGEACPYTIALYVCDKTHVNDTATPHYHYDYWPVKIVNDIG
jgi:hypothetical protein